MARRLQFDRDEAVRRVMELIWREGYEAANVKAASEHLGIARSSYYNAFGSREALFAEALMLYIKEAPDRALREAPADMSVKKVITTLIRDVCRIRSDDKDRKGCLAVNCLGELGGSGGAPGELLHSLFQENIVRMQAFMERGVASGELSPNEDLRTKALALKSILISLNLIAKMGLSEEDLWRQAVALLDGIGLFDPSILSDFSAQQDRPPNIQSSLG